MESYGEVWCDSCRVSGGKLSSFLQMWQGNNIACLTEWRFNTDFLNVIKKRVESEPPKIPISAVFLFIKASNVIFYRFYYIKFLSMLSTVLKNNLMRALDALGKTREMGKIKQRNNYLPYDLIAALQRKI